MRILGWGLNIMRGGGGWCFLADVGVLRQLWYDGACQIRGNALHLSSGKILTKNFWYFWRSPAVQVSSAQYDGSSEWVVVEFWVVQYFISKVHYCVFTVKEFSGGKFRHGEIIINGVNCVIWGISQHVLIFIVVQIELQLLDVIKQLLLGINLR